MSTPIAKILEDSAESDSVSKMLLTGDYDPATQTFMRTDGGVSAFMAVDPLAIVDQPYDTIGRWANSVASGFSNQALRPGTLITWTWYASKDISAFTKAYLAQGGDSHPVLKAQEADKVRRMMEGTEKPILTYRGTDATLNTKNPRTIIGITVFPESNVNRAEAHQEWLGTDEGQAEAGNSIFRQVRKRLNREVTDAMETLGLKLSTCGAKAKLLDENDYLRTVRTLLYPVSGEKSSVTDDIDHPIFDRLPIGDVRVVPSKGYVFSDGVYLKTITLNGVPKATYPGILSMPSRKLNSAALIDLVGRGWITVNARKHDVDADRAEIGERLKRVAGGSVLEGRAESIRRDALQAQQWIDNDGRSLFDVELIVNLWDEDLENLENRARRLTTLMSDLLCRMRLETAAAPSFLFRSLPGNAFPPLDGAHRSHVWPDRKIADLMPLWYRSTGTDEAMSLLVGVTGMPFKVSPFGGGGAVAHFAVAGTTGTGKSVLTNGLVRDHLRNPSSQAILIDKGRSYRAHVLSYGDQGLYVNVSQGNFCVNPLAGPLAEVRDVGGAFIEHLATPTKDQPITAYQKGLLDRAMADSFKEGRRELEDLTYTTIPELMQRFPGTYLHGASKYLVCETITERLAASLENVLADREANDRPYIYCVYRLSFVKTKTGAVINHPRMGQLSQEQEDWLQAKGYILSEDPQTGRPVLYHASRTAESGPDAHGIGLEPDRTLNVVNAPRREHAQILISAGIVFRIPTDMLVERESRERKAIAAEAGSETIAEDMVERRVARVIKQLSGLDVWDQTEGRATLQREVLLGDIGRWLEDRADETDPEVRLAASDLVTRLAGWYGTGPKSSFFDGHTTVDLARYKVIDFELANLADNANEHTVTAVVVAILRLIHSYATSPTRKSQRLMVPVDEVWQLFHFPVIAKALEGVARVGRKTGTALAIITQSLLDMTKNETTRALIGNIKNYYVLRQPETDLVQIAEIYQLSKEEAEMMGGLVSRAGEFSQVMILARDQTPRVADVALNLLTPIELWMWTTKKEEYGIRDEMIDELVMRGEPENTARTRVVETLARQFPRGLTPEAIREINQRRQAQAQAKGQA